MDRFGESYKLYKMKQTIPRTSVLPQASHNNQSSFLASRAMRILNQEEIVIYYRSLFRHYSATQMYLLPILIIVIISVQSNQCQQLGQLRLAANDEDVLPSKQMVNDKSETQTINIRQQQQQTIPAANPNFEAAFQGECGKNNNSNPCEHICLDLHDGTYECSCFYGFTLAVDGYSCAHLAPISHPRPHHHSHPPPTKDVAPASRGSSRERPSPTAAAAAAADVASTLAGPRLIISSPTPLAVALQASVSTRQGSAFAIEPTEEQEIGHRPSDTATNVTGNDVSSWLPAATDRPNERQAGKAAAPNEWIDHQSANDNRKLADELARGATATATSTTTTTRALGVSRGGANAKGDGPWEESNSVVEFGRRRQRMLLGAAARIRQQQEAKLRFAAGGESRNEDRNTGTSNHHGRYLKLDGPANRISSASESAAHEDHGRDEQPLEANTVVLGPQMTTAITGSGAAAIDGDSNSNKENLRVKQRLSYDIDGTLSGQQSRAQEEFVELNLGLDDEDLDPEIRSIMLSNDKLVSLLAGSVASLRAEIKNQEDGDEDEDGTVNAMNNGIGDNGVEKRLTMRSKKNDIDFDTVATSHADRRRQDYEMNSLVNLVRQTIIEGANSRLVEPSARFHQQKIDSQLVYNNHKEEINGPVSVPIGSKSFETDQSFRGKEGAEEAHRKRRSQVRRPIGGHSAKSRPTEQGTIANAVHDLVNISRHAEPQDDDDNLDTQNISHSSHLQPTDLNHNNPCDEIDEPAEVFRDCTEMLECESGGQCFQETAWISSRTSDLAQLEARARCRCPIGRGGQLCQKPIQRSTPKFMGHSYLALPMITEPSITSLRLVFKPELRLGVVQRQSSLLLHSQRFILILDDMQGVELRYTTNQALSGDKFSTNNNTNTSDHNNLSKITRVIGSQDAELNRWNELIMTDVLNDSQMKLEPDDDRIVLVTPDRIHLDNRQQAAGELFVAGFPDLAKAQQQPAHSTNKTLKQHSALLDDKSIGGFTGCIKELSINGRRYNFRSDLEGDALDGFDVVECCGNSMENAG